MTNPECCCLTTFKFVCEALKIMKRIWGAVSMVLRRWGLLSRRCEMPFSIFRWVFQVTCVKKVCHTDTSLLSNCGLPRLASLLADYDSPLRAQPAVWGLLLSSCEKPVTSSCSSSSSSSSSWGWEQYVKPQGKGMRKKIHTHSHTHGQNHIWHRHVILWSLDFQNKIWTGLKEYYILHNIKLHLGSYWGCLVLNSVWVCWNKQKKNNDQICTFQ